MSVTGLLVGLLNIVLVVVILLLIGAVIEWVLRALLNFNMDPLVRRLYIGVVVLIALIMAVRLLLGVPYTFIYWDGRPPP